MPRANRYFLQGNIWHITHRCHKKDFLFKFQKDRLFWMQWLFEAKKRYKIIILNYIVTSNHIHLLVKDNSSHREIPSFMQLLQSRTGQEYNRRKNRKGAFWEDRYHATAVETGDYLIQCMTYINLNMVRAGVVSDPIQWTESGYFEIQNPRKRKQVIDYSCLSKLLNVNLNELQKILKEKIKEAVGMNKLEREGKWTEAIAVGSKDYVESIRKKLNIKAIGRRTRMIEEGYELAEAEIPYTQLFVP
jgi:putative transposase